MVAFFSYKTEASFKCKRIVLVAPGKTNLALTNGSFSLQRRKQALTALARVAPKQQPAMALTLQSAVFAPQ